MRVIVFKNFQKAYKTVFFLRSRKWVDLNLGFFFFFGMNPQRELIYWSRFCDQSSLGQTMIFRMCPYFSSPYQMVYTHVRTNMGSEWWRPEYRDAWRWLTAGGCFTPTSSVGSDEPHTPRPLLGPAHGRGFSSWTVFYLFKFEQFSNWNKFSKFIIFYIWTISEEHF